MRVLVCPTAFKGSIGAGAAAAAMARGVQRSMPDARIRTLPLSDGGPGLLDALRAAGRNRTVEEVEVRGPLGAPARGRVLWVREDRLPPAAAGGGTGSATREESRAGKGEALDRWKMTPAGQASGRGEAPRCAAGGRGGDRGDRPGQAGGAAGDRGADPDAGAGPARADVAVLESADACGLHLVPAGGEDALRAHTAGVGELIRAAVARGAARVVVGLGGSATTDGGTGAARVFGFRFLGGAGSELRPGGGPLCRLDRILPGRAPSVPLLALADVATPLNGARGAARTFGPQKGASAEELECLVTGLERLSARMEEDLGAGDAGELPGSGAAGGLGAGLVAFLGARLAPGAEWVLEATGFGNALREADLLVTGEGAFDATSREGKIVGRVLDRARGASVPVLLLCGRLGAEPAAAEGGGGGAAAGAGSGCRPDAAGAVEGPPVLAAGGGGEWLDAAALEDLAAREAAGLAV